MDAAYDHIQEEVLRPDELPPQSAGGQQLEGGLNTDLQEAYKSFSASPWGARLGGFFGTVRKQGESYYQGARQEAAAASEEAFKGFSDLRSTLVSRARSLSTGEGDVVPSTSTAISTASSGENVVVHGGSEEVRKQRTDTEALQESESLISRFQKEAAKRLKDIEKAEDAADEALLKFGTNIRNFLRDAVSIAPPTDEKDEDGNSKVLFESKDLDGKRIIHTTRFDAQLHAVHSSMDSFTKDPVSPEYEKWKLSDFSVERKTDDIAADLDKHEELRRAMEKLVPEKVEYEQFWKRYYFLRMVIETEEQRRKDLLKGATLSTTEEVAWDEDSDDEPSTPQPKSSSPFPHPPSTSTSSPHPNSQMTTIVPTPTGESTSTATAEADSLKPSEPRKSQDQHSQPDSDASYDLVSGAASHAPPSPRDGDEKKKNGKGSDSDEEDWE
ncbi:hypothetical protein MMC19_005519 [Ptychographa xylographoides]|nr:hypothetical protein [Ptychographa xylographoides]